MARSLALGVFATLVVFAAVALTAAAEAQDELSPLARSIQNDLNRLDGQVGRDAHRPASERLQSAPAQRRGAARLFTPSRQRSGQDIDRSSDLGAARQDLRTLKTREPDDAAIPVLERQLDRVSGQAGGSNLYQPSRDPAALYGR